VRPVWVQVYRVRVWIWVRVMDLVMVILVTAKFFGIWLGFGFHIA